jgi:hypothetical protein
VVQVDQVRQATVSHTRDEMMNVQSDPLFKAHRGRCRPRKLIHSDVASVLEHWVNCGERFRLFAKIVEEWPGKRIFVAPLQGQQGGWISGPISRCCLARAEAWLGKLRLHSDSAARRIIQSFIWTWSFLQFLPSLRTQDSTYRIMTSGS